MNTSFSIRTMMIGLLLVALIVVGKLAFHFHGNAVEAGEQLKEQKKTLAQQSGLISTLQEQDRKNRALAAEQLRREQQLRQRGERYQRELREALKNDKCGNSLMPRAVIDLLQQNAATGTSTGSAPPESVFTPCEQPQLQGETWGDALSSTLALQTALSICAAQVGTLNQWKNMLSP